MKQKGMLLAGLLALILVLCAAAAGESAVAADTDLLEGTWVMTGFTGGEIDSCAMIFMDGVLTMTFTSNGETVSNQAPYTFDGTNLILEGEEPTAIVLNGDVLTITDAGQTMTLVRQNTEASLEGAWVMTDFTDDTIESCTMEFAGGILIMTVSLNGESQTQQTPYMFDGAKLYLYGEVMADIELNGDILKVTDAGKTMTLQRK